uniref:Uncharacterized protein LOC104240638 n=1 Tax=Nicotiana sylvestris TaxID=4096 RepID=A0A1U7XW17_NICSY|nr:PREDICTED: uncharacterized protein LOC104240638 [Nicotiana sylvestris]
MHTQRQPSLELHNHCRASIYHEYAIFGELHPHTHAQNQEKVSENLDFQEFFLRSGFANRLLRFSEPVRFQSRFFGPGFHSYTAALIGKSFPFEGLVKKVTNSQNQLKKGVKHAQVQRTNPSTVATNPLRPHSIYCSAQ